MLFFFYGICCFVFYRFLKKGQKTVSEKTRKSRMNTDCFGSVNPSSPTSMVRIRPFPPLIQNVKSLITKGFWRFFYAKMCKYQKTPQNVCLHKFWYQNNNM